MVLTPALLLAQSSIKHTRDITGYRNYDLLCYFNLNFSYLESVGYLQCERNSMFHFQALLRPSFHNFCYPPLAQPSVFSTAQIKLNLQ